MRQDMPKVIVERARRPGWGRSRTCKGRVVDPDLLPGREGMRRPYVAGYAAAKTLNENLAPLRRFLRSQVGRKWDDIYSEITSHLRVSSAVQQHVRDHLSDFVTAHTRMIGGEACGAPVGTGPRPLEACTEMHVDQDGYLRLSDGYQSWRRRFHCLSTPDKSREAGHLLIAAGGTEYRKHAGIWYRVLWGEVPATQVACPPTHLPAGGVAPQRQAAGRDVFTGEFHHFAGARFRCGKRQLGRQELRRLGLVNG